MIASVDEFCAQLEAVFQAAESNSSPRYIYVHARAAKLLRRYRPKPSRTVRTFKLRYKRKKLK
jgi:hypothetical protein